MQLLRIAAATLAATVAASTTAEQRREQRGIQAQKFMEWLDSIDGADRRASLQWINDEFGYGVMSDGQHGPLNDGSLLVQMPLKAVVSRQTLLTSKASPTASSRAGSTGHPALNPDRLKRVWQHLQDDSDVIALWLMRARALGALRAAGLEPGPATPAVGRDDEDGTAEPDLADPAAWWPYLDVLPRAVPVPATWPQGRAGTDLLHDERAAAEAFHVRSGLLERYYRAVGAIREVFHDFSAQRMADAVAAYIALETNRTIDEVRADGYGKLPAGVDGSAVVRATPIPNMPGGDGRLADPKLDLTTGLQEKLLPGTAVWKHVGMSHDSLASFVWAATLIDSRALTIRGEKWLVPFADMLNFQAAPGAGTRQANAGAAFLAYHQLDKASGRFRVLADRFTPVGAQVFEDYGDSDSGLYLQHHGMVPVNITRDNGSVGSCGPACRGTQADPKALEESLKIASWAHMRVKRVDAVASNPFDCVRPPFPALKQGPKNSTAERRRTLAQALGLSPAAINRTCLHQPAMYIVYTEGADMPLFNQSAADPVPMEVHHWLSIVMMDKEQLASPACTKIIAAFTQRRERKSGGADDAEADDIATAAGTASSGSGKSSKDEPGFTQADVDECLVTGEFEFKHLLALAKANASSLEYGIPGREVRRDDGSQPITTGQGFQSKDRDIMLSGHPSYHPKTMAGRTARFIRKLLAGLQSKYAEDLSLLTALETAERADAVGLPTSTLHSLVLSAVQGIQPVGRQRFLLAQTFGRKGGMYARAWVTDKAAEDEEEDTPSTGDYDKDSAAAAAKNPNGYNPPEEMGSPSVVDRDHVRLALYYRASRKYMLKNIQEWLEGQEAAVITKVKLAAGILPMSAPVVPGEAGQGQAGTDAVGSETAPSSSSAAAQAAAARAVSEVSALESGASTASSSATDANATVAIGLVQLHARDAACYFTEDEFAAAESLCERFNAWFDRLQPAVNHVKAVPVGGGMRLGVVTTRSLDQEEVYLAAPLDAILDSEAARRDRSLGPVLSAIRKKYPQGDDFHELMLLLLLESGVRHTAAGGQGSVYGPYLETLPDPDHMPFPVFYTPRELTALLGSAGLRALLEYRQAIRGKYAAVNAAVIDAYPRTFNPPAAFNLARYRWGTAILDSRAIWWGGSRHLVPLLDLINCDEGPKPGRVHATRLDPRGEYAVTRADRVYGSGEQLMENYGQPNWIYFSYHGFSLLKNSYDCVKMELELPPTVAAAVASEMARRRSRRKASNKIDGATPTPSPEPAPDAAADTAAWTAWAALLEQSKAANGAGVSPKWASNETITLPWARAELLQRRGKGPAIEIGSNTPEAEMPKEVISWLSNYAYSDADEPYTAAGAAEAAVIEAAGAAEQGLRKADATLWDGMRGLMRTGPVTIKGSRIFAVQCVKPDALVPPGAAGTGNETSAEAAVDATATQSAAPTTSSDGLPPDSPRYATHADTEEAIEWLRWGWNTDRLGALLLLRSHARAALGRYPTRLAADVRALLADSAAQLVLGLSAQDDAMSSAKALLQYVYGNSNGYSLQDAALQATVSGGLPTDDTDANGSLPGSYPLGRFTLVHWQSEVLAQAKESNYRGDAKLARAKAALLPPRLRSITQFLVTEKVQLLQLAGFDPLGRGLGRYHPLLGACGPGQGGTVAKGNTTVPCTDFLDLKPAAVPSSTATPAASAGDDDGEEL